MSSIGDTSHISNLSSISRISRSSSIRPSTKPCSEFDVSECRASSSIREPLSRAAVAASSRRSRVIKLLETCETAISNRAKLELLHMCLQDEAERQCQEPRTDKLRSILARHEAKKFLRLPDDKKSGHGDISLLGIVSDAAKFQLSLLERREISICVEKAFQERTNRFIECYEKSGGKIDEILRCHESAGKASLSENHETDLMRWNDRMNEICTEYHRDLLAHADTLSRWRQLKYNEMRELNARKAENLLLQAQFAEMDAAESTRTCNSLMFNETPFTVEAFAILSETIDAKILEVREGIQKKEVSKMTYTDASSRDYDQLLKRYTELCNAIKKKERLMEIL